MLLDALDLDPSRVRPGAREPLGEGSIAGFDVTDASSGSLLQYYVDTSRLPVPAETGLVAGDPSAPDARVWLHPSDPHLPALAPAAFGHAAQALLARIGVVGSEQAQLAAYRPGRRAVLSIDTAASPMWIKVVRPDRVERIVAAHAVFERAGLPVPAVRAWSPEGLVVIDAAEGVPATDVEWEPDQLLDEVESLQARLRGLALEEPVRGVGGRLAWYRGRLRDAPGLDPRRADELGRAAERVLADTAPVPASGVHGDLHYGQLFLRDGRISGLIDLDTAGKGDPAEDRAAFLAHAAASAPLTAPGAGRDRVEALADAALARWGDDPRMRALAVVHLLGHALGASDTGDDDRAETLISAAERVEAGSATT